MMLSLNVLKSIPGFIFSDEMFNKISAIIGSVLPKVRYIFEVLLSPSNHKQDTFFVLSSTVSCIVLVLIFRFIFGFTGICAFLNTRVTYKQVNFFLPIYFLIGSIMQKVLSADKTINIIYPFSQIVKNATSNLISYLIKIPFFINIVNQKWSVPAFEILVFCLIHNIYKSIGYKISVIMGIQDEEFNSIYFVANLVTEAFIFPFYISIFYTFTLLINLIDTQAFFDYVIGLNPSTFLELCTKIMLLAGYDLVNSIL